MSNMRMKHKLIMSMMAGAIIIPGVQSEHRRQKVVTVRRVWFRLQELKTFGSIISDRNKEQYQSVSGADRRGEYLNIAFSNTGIIPILEAKQMKTVNGLENYILIQRQLCWNIWMDGQRFGREMQRGMFRPKHCSQEKKPVRGQMSIQMRMLQSQQIV